jgi:hypothetical protein
MITLQASTGERHAQLGPSDCSGSSATGVHRCRSPRSGRPWTVLDLCELHLKLQPGGLGEPGSVVAAVARTWKETA